MRRANCVSQELFFVEGQDFRLINEIQLSSFLASSDFFKPSTRQMILSTDQSMNFVAFVCAIYDDYIFHAEVI